MALIEMVMPKMGESIIEGTILNWLKKEGDRIEQDEAVLEVATDKVDTEVPATHAGVLRQILVQAGDVVQVGAPIAVIATEADAENQAAPVAQSPAAVAEPEPEPEAVEQAQALEVQISRMATPQLLDAPVAGRFYSPLVLTIAREEGISMAELERVPGSGGDNRVTKKDILQYVQSKNPDFVAPALNTTPAGNTSAPSQSDFIEKTPETPATQPTPATLADETLSLIAKMRATPKDVPTSQPMAEQTTPIAQKPAETQPVAQPPVQATVPPDTPEQTQEVPIANTTVNTPQQPAAGTVQMPEMQPEAPAQPTPTQPSVPVQQPVVRVQMDRMRKMIAQRMVDSKRISPHVTSFVEADVTNMVFWRNRVKQEFKAREGDTITFTPVFIEAIAKAIKDYPMINASVEGDKIIVKKDINIGMAVALPTGNLIVPVIQNADQYNIVGLTKKVNDLARRARDNKLTADDLAGGTFTMSNVGSFGNVMGTPIIMQPQVAIMAFGAIQKKPAVIETPFGDTLGIRHLMFLSHSYDHRVVDGSLGGMFVRRVADYLEGFDVNRKIG
ncbi:MAG: 2-oxo acid dehydrogenase subunit E2 [Cytophagales bacterium]|nr:2-oxo acid dehydrogenase subunit E2 [Cytophagales bacterium]